MLHAGTALAALHEVTWPLALLPDILARSRWLVYRVAESLRPAHVPCGQPYDLRAARTGKALAEQATFSRPAT